MGVWQGSELCWLWGPEQQTSDWGEFLDKSLERGGPGSAGSDPAIQSQAHVQTLLRAGIGKLHLFLKPFPPGVLPQWGGFEPARNSLWHPTCGSNRQRLLS